MRRTAHGAIGATTQRKRGPRTPGTASRTACRREPETVSGTLSNEGSITAINAMCGRYGTVLDAGAHCASTPATSGPREKPAVIAIAARRAAPLGLAVPTGATESSRTHAVPAANTAPLLTPASRRPTNNSATLWAPATSTALAMSDSPAAGMTTLRRPRASDTGPASSSPGIRPSA